MRTRFRNFLHRHPCLWQAFLWSIPALLAGLVLRGLVIHHNPYAYWSEDSYSYIHSIHTLVTKGEVDLDAKRRWTYPIALTVPYLLPGSTLRWTSLFQHAATLLTTIAFGYTVRKIFSAWRVLIVPATLLFALHPHLIYYSNQLLAEALFLVSLVWTVAGWVAWMKTPARTQLHIQRFLLFFGPFAILMLTKPAGRFFWPGLVIALLLSGTWRRIRIPHGVLLAGLLALTFTVGSEGQGVRLLYSSSFPLTRLDTPGNAEYKKEIAPMVGQARALLHRYYDADQPFKNFLKAPDKERPDLQLWSELAEKKNRTKREKLYRNLALEGIRHEPHLMLYIATQKIVGSHVAGLKEDRLSGVYLAERLAEPYFYEGLSKDSPLLLKKLFGIPADAGMPSLKALQEKIAPHAGSKFENWLIANFTKIEKALRLAQPPPAMLDAPPLYTFRPTLLGLLAATGFALGFLKPYRDSIGVWNVMLFAYLFGVYAIGSTNGRFFVPALPWIFLLWMVPLDRLWCAALAWRGSMRWRRMPDDSGRVGVSPPLARRAGRLA